MKIDNILLDNLTAQAQVSPRLRINLDLRNSDADCSQRMLNAIEPGSVVPIHRHQKTSETAVILEMKDGAYEPILECDVLKYLDLMSFRSNSLQRTRIVQ